MPTTTTAPTAATEIEALRHSAQDACTLLKALSNPDRLMLLCEMAQGEKTVTELQEALGITQPTLSQQLAVLRAQALVDTRREGKNIFYRLASPQAMAVMQVLYEQFCRPSTKGNAR